MIIPYNEIMRKPQEQGCPELYVGCSFRFLLSLRSTDFQVVYHDGKAEVSLSRYMSAEEAKALGEALIVAADEAILDMGKL